MPRPNRPRPGVVVDLGAADPGGAARLRRSRILSYVLLSVGVVLLSLAPSQLGVPDDPTLRVLFVVVRPIVAGLLVLGAGAVQVIVGVRWRRDITRANEADASASAVHHGEQR